MTYILSGKLREAKQMLEQVRGDSVAEEGLRMIDTLEASSQSASTTLSNILKLNAFGNSTVHDFEQDPVLKDPHDHDCDHAKQ